MYNDEPMLSNAHSRTGLCRRVARDDGLLGIALRRPGGIVGVSHDCVWSVKEISGVSITKQRDLSVEKQETGSWPG